MDVREARIPDELPSIRALFEEYAATLDFDLCFQGFADELARLPGKYVAPRGGLWIAVDDGGIPVGCIALRPFEATTAELKRLYLRPAARGTGVGRRLARRALAHAMQAGYASVRLDTLPSMKSAIALYRSLGFVSCAPYYDNPIAETLFFECRL